MKDYYSLLRISRQASDAEVKHAFRRLAILLHPDKNPHPDAPAAFQELNEAYEVLGDPVRRVLYDQLLGVEANVEAPIQHRDPAYRRKQNPNYKPPKPEPTAGYLLMMKLMPLTTPVCWTGLVICFFVWLDFTLPRVAKEEHIIETQRTLHHHIMYTDKGHMFTILFPQNRHFIREPDITVYTSRLFSFLDRIETRSGTFQYDNIPSVFRNFMFGPLVMSVLAAIAVFLPKGETKFSLTIAIVILLILNTAFLVYSVW
jgi:curved DNA-binding protein CbpA